MKFLKMSTGFLENVEKFNLNGNYKYGTKLILLTMNKCIVNKNRNIQAGKEKM